MRIGEQVTLSNLIEKLGVVPRHHRLLRRLLEFLVEDGILEPVTAEASNGRAAVETWTVATPAPPLDPDRQLSHLLAHFPAMSPELLFAQRGGVHLSEALLGQIDPSEILFPDRSFELADELYRKSPAALVFNNLAQAAVKQMIGKFPSGRRLRVLEVGAGTGGVTSAILAALPADRTHYVFTDLSPTFFAKQRKISRHFHS